MRYTFVGLLACLLFWGCTQKENKAINTNNNNSETISQPTTTPEAKLLSQNKKGTTPTGYRYVHHFSYDGPKPALGDEVRYHEIVFNNDSLIKSSHYGFEPIRAIIPTKDKIADPPPPNYDAVMMMSPGDSMTIWHDVGDEVSLPKWLEKGDQLRYELTMISIRPRAAIEAGIEAVKAREQTVGDSLRQKILDFKNGKLADQLTATESGLQYIIHDPGKGEQVKKGNFLKVHYMGCLQESGASFNNTYGPARPFPFQVGRGRVIKGWDEGLLQLKKGGKMTLFIPYQLGYGEAGRPGEDGGIAYIPERADLAFYVELLDIR